MNTDELSKNVLEEEKRVELIRRLWGSLLGAPGPKGIQCSLWLERFPLEQVLRAVRQTAKKNFSLNGAMSEEHMLRFATSVMATFAERQRKTERNAATLSDGAGRNKGAVQSCA